MAFVIRDAIATPKKADRGANQCSKKKLKAFGIISARAKTLDTYRFTKNRFSKYGSIVWSEASSRMATMRT